jgi:hypothetical protein
LFSGRQPRPQREGLNPFDGGPFNQPPLTTFWYFLGFSVNIKEDMTKHSKAPEYASDKINDIEFCELYDAAASLMNHLGAYCGKNEEWPIQIKVQGEGDAKAVQKRFNRLERILKRLGNKW